MSQDLHQVNERDDWDKHWEGLAKKMQTNPVVIYRWREIFKLFDFKKDDKGNFLDIGCGDGSFLFMNKNKLETMNLAGIDISESGLNLARKMLNKALFKKVDLSKSQNANKEFNNWANYAICSEVIEHLDFPVEFLSNAKSLLSKNCRLIITVPAGPMSPLDYHVGHRKHYTPKILKKELESAGYKVIKIQRSGFPFQMLYRIMVLLRGENLINDAEGESSGVSKLLMSLILKTFSFLFLFNFKNFFVGWQLLAEVQPIK